MFIAVMASLASRVALVTGSTMGVGLAVARALASKGAGIIMTDRPGDKKLINECQQAIKRYGYHQNFHNIRNDVYFITTCGNIHFYLKKKTVML